MWVKAARRGQPFEGREHILHDQRSLDRIERHEMGDERLDEMFGKTGVEQDALDEDEI